MNHYERLARIAAISAILIFALVFTIAVKADDYEAVIEHKYGEDVAWSLDGYTLEECLIVLERVKLLHDKIEANREILNAYCRRRK